MGLLVPHCQLQLGLLPDVYKTNTIVRSLTSLVALSCQPSSNWILAHRLPLFPSSVIIPGDAEWSQTMHTKSTVCTIWWLDSVVHFLDLAITWGYSSSKTLSFNISLQDLPSFHLSHPFILPPLSWDFFERSSSFTITQLLLGLCSL